MIGLSSGFVCEESSPFREGSPLLLRLVRWALLGGLFFRRFDVIARVPSDFTQINFDIRIERRVTSI